MIGTSQLVVASVLERAIGCELEIITGQRALEMPWDPDWDLGLPDLGYRQTFRYHAAATK